MYVRAFSTDNASGQEEQEDQTLDYEDCRALDLRRALHRVTADEERGKPERGEQDPKRMQASEQRRHDRGKAEAG